MINKLISSIKHSTDGLREAYKLEPSFKFEVIIAFILVPLAFYIGKSFCDKVLLSGSIIFVMIIELLNSALEKTIDELGQNRRTPLFKYAKDCGSAAVMLSIILGVMFWISYLLALI